MDGLYQDIRNANEEFIASKLEQVWETSKYCQCDKCKRDVYTYVLNRIEPHYVDSTQGELFMKLSFRDRGHNIEVIKIINTAMEVVGKNPRHDAGAVFEEGELSQGESAKAELETEPVGGTG